ncbi:MAG: serine hydrolase, partial [Ktedonobacteraceae bacterium]|nr:serine hydrolase [Ktedonobacteraceae bacterium]
WEDFVRQRIMEPLGMTGSNFATDASRQTSDYAMPYKKIKGEVRLVDFYDKLAAIAPAGAINSSVADMSKWVLLQLNKGKQGETQLISEARLGQIHTPYMLVPDPRKYTEVHYASYGLGWSINSYRGHLVVQHGGGIDGFSALTMLFPDDNIGMVVLTNREGCPAHTVVAFNAFERLLGLSETPWSERFKKEVDEQEEMLEKGKQESASKRVLDTHPSHELSAYTGDFEHPGYGRLSVTLEDGHLQVIYNTMQCELEHYHYDIFDINYEEFEGVVLKAVFTIGVEGDVESLAIGLGLDPALGPIVFKRVAQAGDAEKA